MSESVWRFARASAIGTSHERSGTGCQDFHACRVLRDSKGKPTIAIAVSDGAGSASRGEIGSELTCTTLFELIEAFLTDGNDLASVTREIAVQWILGARETIADHAATDNCALRDYACTALFAVLAEDSAIFLQVGDGAIVLPAEESEWCWTFWPAKGEFANTTFFVTDDKFEPNIMFEARQRPVDEIAVFTDGIEALVLHYASKSVHSPFFERMMQPVRASGSSGEDAELSAALQSYLASPEITRRTDDDKTLVLATRRAAVASE